VRNAARTWLSDGVFVLNVQPFPEYHAEEGGADRSKLPEVGSVAPLTLPPLQRTTLSNGLKVVLAERHEVPVIQLSLIVDAGHAADSLAKPGTSNLALAMISNGTKSRDALQIAARSEELGAEISAGSTLDTSFISLNSITSQLADSLELFGDILLNPTFPTRSCGGSKRSRSLLFSRRSRNHKASPPACSQAGVWRGPRVFQPILRIGSEQTVQSMTVDELRAFYRRWVRPDNATLLIVGDTTLKQTEPLLEQRLARWQPPAEPLPVKQLASVPMPAKPRIFLVNRTGAEQSLIFAVEVAPPRSDPDDIAFETVNTVLGGSFISRLNMNLRQDKHWSYGAGPASSVPRGSGRSSSAPWCRLTKPPNPWLRR